jgi:hypothetical protein
LRSGRLFAVLADIGSRPSPASDAHVKNNPTAKGYTYLAKFRLTVYIHIGERRNLCVHDYSGVCSALSHIRVAGTVHCARTVGLLSQTPYAICHRWHSNGVLFARFVRARTTVRSHRGKAARKGLASCPARGHPVPTGAKGGRRPPSSQKGFHSGRVEGEANPKLHSKQVGGPVKGRLPPVSGAVRAPRVRTQLELVKDSHGAACVQPTTKG